MSAESSNVRDLLHTCLDILFDECKVIKFLRSIKNYKNTCRNQHTSHDQTPIPQHALHER